MNVYDEKVLVRFHIPKVVNRRMFIKTMLSVSRSDYCLVLGIWLMNISLTSMAYSTFYWQLDVHIETLNL